MVPIEHNFHCVMLRMQSTKVSTLTSMVLPCAKTAQRVLCAPSIRLHLLCQDIALPFSCMHARDRGLHYCSQEFADICEHGSGDAGTQQCYTSYQQNCFWSLGSDQNVVSIFLMVCKYDMPQRANRPTYASLGNVACPNPVHRQGNVVLRHHLTP